jgi:hypothetical protein
MQIKYYSNVKVCRTKEVSGILLFFSFFLFNYKSQVSYACELLPLVWALKKSKGRKNSQVSYFRHICIFWERKTGAIYVTNKPGRKTIQNKTCIYFNPVIIAEHLQVSEIWHLKKRFKRKLSFKIISGEGPVISTQKHQLLNDRYSSIIDSFSIKW